MTKKDIENLIKADQILDKFAFGLKDALDMSDIPHAIPKAQSLMMNVVMNEWSSHSGFKGDTQEYDDVCDGIYFSNVSLKKKVDIVANGKLWAEKENKDDT